MRLPKKIFLLVSRSPSGWSMRKIGRIRQEIGYFQALVKDERTPKIAKWCLAGGVAYLLMPFDLIPDFIPVLGQLDDIVIVPVLIWVGLKLIPDELKRELRNRLAINT